MAQRLLQQAVDHRASGRFEQAEALCQQAMELAPGDAPARHLLALIHRDRGNHQRAVQILEELTQLETPRPEHHKDLADTLASRGKVTRAVENYLKALDLKPDYFEVHANLGNLLLKLQRVDQALVHYHEAARLRPEIAALHDNLGNALRISGDPKSAVSCHKEALRLDPGLVYAHINLGVALNELGRHDEAVDALQQALRLAPNIPQSHFYLATALGLLGRHAESLEQFQQTIALDATKPEYHKGLADIYVAMGDITLAVPAYRKALELNPDYFEAHVDIADALLSGNGRQPELAITHYQEAIRIRPDSAPDIQCTLGHARLGQERFKDALEHYREVRRLQSSHFPAAMGEFTALRKLGELEEARRCIEPFSDMRSQNRLVALAYSYLVQNDDERRASVGELKAMLTQDVPDKNELRTLYARLGDLCDSLHSYEEAFEYYRRANEHRPQDFKRIQYRRYIDRLLSGFSQERLQTLPSASNDSELPVFVVGMPRAGKTLVEQILASHPQVTGAGELPDMWDLVASITQQTGQPFPLGMEQISVSKLNEMAQGYLSKRLQQAFPGSTRVVDTMPDNIHLLGLIRLLFPRAHIIHCLRDPLDTCLECYFKNFRKQAHPYACDLGDLGFRYRHYRRLSEHWRNLTETPLLEVQYEELVRNPEKTAREIVGFLGLNWDSRCLDFHTPGTAHLTGAFEILEPINTHSIGHWKHYESHIQPLVQGLQDTDPAFKAQLKPD